MALCRRRSRKFQIPRLGRTILHGPPVPASLWPMGEIANPHDTYFRESFGRAEVARDFLCVHLPPAVLAELDLDSLEIAKDSYVSSDLRPVF